MFFNRFFRPLLPILALAAVAVPVASAQTLRANPFSVSVYFQRNTPAGTVTSRSIELTNITSRVQVTSVVDSPSNINWLIAAPTVLNPAEGATRRVDLTILPGSLSPGTYTASVRFTPETGLALIVPVTLVVSDLRMQNPSPSSVEFVVQRGAPRTSAIPINISATTGTLSITASAQTSPTPWLLVDQGPITTPGVINVSAVAGDLNAGEYLGSVTLQATGGAGEAIGNPGITVPIRIRVVDDSSLTAVPSAISFDYQVGGVVPAPRTVSVSSTGSVLNFIADVATPGTNVAWLSVTPLLGNTPQSLSLSLQNLTNLTAGTYTGTITINSPNNQSQVVTVTLRVSTNPLLNVAPGQLTFTFQQGGAQPPSQTIVVSTSGNPATLNAHPLGAAVQWLTVSTPSAITPAGIVVGVNTTSLAPGVYEGQLEITGGDSPLLVPVKLVVGNANQPLLRVTQNRLEFAVQTTGTTNTLTQTLDVTSTGNPIQYTATTTTGASWLSVTPLTSQATPSVVTATVNPANLPAGVYNAQVSLQTADLGAVALVIPVRMVVSTLPLLRVTPSALSFTGAGATTTLRQSINVGSTSTNFAYQATSSIAGGGNWLVIAQSNSNTGSTVEVGVNPVVSEGSGLVAITAPGIENSPVFVPVTLSNTGPTSSLTVAPALLDFLQVVGAAAPPAQTLDISLGQGGGLTSYQIGEIRYLSGANWLRVNKTGGIAPDKVEVSIDATGLAPSRYPASIPITSSVGNREVVVILEVRQVVNTFTASPETLTFNFTPGGTAPASQPLQVVASSAPISFTASASVATGIPSWLVLGSSAGTTPAVLAVSVNPAGVPAGTHQGTITLTGVGGSPVRTVSVTLVVAATATPVVSRMVNAASFLDVPAVPGMIISLIGTNLGPAAGVAAAPNGAGIFDRQLANVKVIFDTFEAPILFASSTQVNAIVPYLIGTRLSTRVQVEVNGVRSNVIELRVAAAAPGIFVLNGAGQGAILNQDNTVNGAGNAAARESIIVIYATGEGQTNPPGVDGSIPGRSTDLKTPQQRVRVRMGGQEAEVLYAGSAPFLVSGAMQINARVPTFVVPGSSVPIEVIVGETSSASGVTVAIR